ncbi:MAG TPA: tRNA (adenosine(37)-N6)-threonylcarbamoyltransferase complex dimerization subunit type 1 TsaB [Pyrinomonadaceae bacterium]
MANFESPIILSIETATRAGSLALVKGERVLASRTGDANASHSSDLLRHVKSMLEETRLTLQQVDLFAASAGPGSFTGLRIGLATIKSFAATLERPCLGVQTLQAIAFSAGASACTLALLLAGRGEVFAQKFSVDQEGNIKELNRPAHLAPLLLLDQIKDQPRLILAGEGAHVQADLIQKFASSHDIEFLKLTGEIKESELKKRDAWLLAPPLPVLAHTVAAVALKRFRDGEAHAPELLQAIYVRPSDAELKEKC